MNRRDHLHLLTALGLYPFISNWTWMEEIRKRKIPATGEAVACIGLGTWQTFDVAEDSSELIQLKQVLETLVQKGSSVVDSSPMYGYSEKVVGDLSTELGINNQLFIATKVWTNGKENGIRQDESVTGAF